MLGCRRERMATKCFSMTGVTSVREGVEVEIDGLARTNPSQRVSLARREQSERMAALKAMEYSQRKLFLGLRSSCKSASPDPQPTT